jgi:hypothetical protein
MASSLAPAKSISVSCASSENIQGALREHSGNIQVQGYGLLARARLVHLLQQHLRSFKHRPQAVFMTLSTSLPMAAGIDSPAAAINRGLQVWTDGSSHPAHPVDVPTLVLFERLHDDFVALVPVLSVGEAELQEGGRLRDLQGTGRASQVNS